jgi:hypothetical protein
VEASWPPWICSREAVTEIAVMLADQVYHDSVRK